MDSIIDYFTEKHLKILLNNGKLSSRDLQQSCEISIHIARIILEDIVRKLADVKMITKDLIYYTGYREIEENTEQPSKEIDRKPRIKWKDISKPK